MKLILIVVRVTFGLVKQYDRVLTAILIRQFKSNTRSFVSENSGKIDQNDCETLSYYISNSS